MSHVWLVDPDARYVEVFRLAPGGYVQVAVAGDAEPAARLEPFAEVALDLGALWPAAPEGSGEPGRAGSGE